MVARRAHNPKVVGSNPASATKWSRGVAVITSACHAEDREFNSRRDRHLLFGSVAQSVEQGTENPCVDGSIPFGATIIILQIFFIQNILFALVAQLDRVFGYEPKGQGFESLRAHHIDRDVAQLGRARGLGP